MPCQQCVQRCEYNFGRQQLQCMNVCGAADIFTCGFGCGFITGGGFMPGVADATMSAREEQSEAWTDPSQLVSEQELQVQRKLNCKARMVRMKTDRQTVLIGTRTHTPPDSISSRLRLCISHATRTYRDYISSPWVWKRYNASPAEPRRPVYYDSSDKGDHVANGRYIDG